MKKEEINMKKFICDHPFITFLIVDTLVGGVVALVQTLKSKEGS
jgi:hypothetical protein